MKTDCSLISEEGNRVDYGQMSRVYIETTPQGISEFPKMSQ